MEAGVVMEGKGRGEMGRERGTGEWGGERVVGGGVERLGMCT